MIEPLRSWKKFESVVDPGEGGVCIQASAAGIQDIREKVETRNVSVERSEKLWVSPGVGGLGLEISLRHLAFLIALISSTIRLDVPPRFSIEVH